MRVLIITLFESSCGWGKPFAYAPASCGHQISGDSEPHPRVACTLRYSICVLPSFGRIVPNRLVSESL
jgi:hypothetical protein